MPHVISHNRDEIVAALERAEQVGTVASDVETADRDGNPSTKYWEDGFQVTHYGACWDDEDAITFDPRKFPDLYKGFLKLKQIVHGAEYEGGVWERDVKIVGCTKLMSKLTDQTKPSSLEEAASRYLFMPLWKGHETTWEHWAERNLRDVVATWKLAWKLWRGLDSRRRNLHDEILLPSAIIYGHIPRRGLRLDCDNQRKLEWELTVEANEVYEQLVASGMPRGANINSPPQMRRFLYEQMRIPVPDRAYTKSGEASTDANTMAQLALAYPVCGLVRKWRGINKLKSNYVYHSDDGFGFLDILHPTFNLTGADTGRASSQNPNGQNFSRQPRVRRNYIPSRDLFLSLDMKQAELVIRGARLANDPTMVRVYKNGGDIHTETCLAIVGDLTKENRTKAKTANFSLLYGGKWQMFQLIALKNFEIVLTDGEAFDMHRGWFDKYYGIKEENARIARQVLLAPHKTHGPTGRVYDHSEYARSRARHHQEEAIRQGYNYSTQGAAFDLCCLGLIELDRLDSQAPTLTVHDNVVADVYEKDWKELEHEWRTAWERRMQEVWPHEVPLRVESSIGPNLGDLKEVA